MINKKTIKIFLVILIPILFIWLFLVANNLYKDREYLIQSSINQNKIEDHNTSVLIDKYLFEIFENLKIVRDANELKDYANNENPITHKNLTNMFTRIMNNKKDYAQIRYIDLTGQEKIRVENKKTGFCTITKGRLENKKNYYYFKNTIKLKHNQVYISPLDLNVENNKIEKPYNPMIRFSTPIFDNNNNLKGILIINYKAQYFLNLLKNHEPHSDTLHEDYYVLNKNGQFILNSETGLNFSFMYRNFKDLVFKDSKIWTEMNSNDYGFIKTPETLYTYYDLLSTTKTSVPEYSEKWLMVHKVHLDNVLSFNNVIQEFTKLQNITIFIFILFLAYILAYYIEQLREKNTELDITMKIADFSNDAVMITDNRTKITYVNESYRNLTGYSMKEIVGLTPGNLNSGKHSRAFYNKMWKEIVSTGKWNGLIWGKRKDGLLFPEKLRIVAVKNENGVHHYIGILSDISSNKMKREITGNLTYKNGQIVLTNEDLALELLKKSAENAKEGFMVLCISIENLNQLVPIFEILDEDISDIFIRLIAPMLSKTDFTAQTGRNLFTIGLDLKNIQASPKEIAADFYKKLTKIFTLNERDIFFQIKIGIAFLAKEVNDIKIKQLALNSLIAVDWVKSKKDLNIAFYKKEMTTELNRENEIENQLQKAILKNEFFLVYQPQVDTRTGQVVGMEALLRWHNDELGEISPFFFIPIAEKSNLIVEIGDWVITQACKELKNLNKNFPEEMKNLRCAINLSSIQLSDNNFIGNLLSIIDKYNINYHQLEMEITESLLIENLQKNINLLKSIQKLGMTVALDDFGTGYSSFSYLLSLPVDKIKIDRSFIKNYPEKDDGTLIKILVDMSNKLNKKVLTEGAETLEQVEFLKAIGCNYIQGYYYSKPLLKDAFIKYVQENKKQTKEN